MTQLFKLRSSIRCAGKPNLSRINASQSTNSKTDVDRKRGQHLLGRVHASHECPFNYANFILPPGLPVVCDWFFFLFQSVTQYLYQIAFSSARKSYSMSLLFTHENSDFGAITVTEPSCAAPIPKVERQIWRRFCEPLCVILRCSLNTYSCRRGSE